MKENLENILTEIVDLLEGGDIVEDFDDNPYAVGILSLIHISEPTRPEMI